MGRHSTGVCTTGEVHRIELSYLLRQGFIRNHRKVSGTLSWTNGSCISFESSFTDEEKYLRLIYYIQNSYTGEKTNHDYKILLTTIPSNLGKGEIIYFVCPSTGKRARILYRCYGSPIWKCRIAYRYRIYYESQQCSKLDFHNRRYWALEKQIETLNKQVCKKLYRGRYTRQAVRLTRLKVKQLYHDRMRWLIVPQYIQKMVNENGLPNAEGLF
jgi:hypothetical protein